MIGLSEVPYSVTPGEDTMALVYGLLQFDAYIAGSYAAYWLPHCGARPNDIDIFMKHQDREQCIDLYWWLGEQPWIEPGSLVVNKWTTSWDVDDLAFNGAGRIQVVNPFSPDEETRLTHGKIDDVLHEFDFSIVQAALLPTGIKVGFTTVRDIEEGVMRVTRRSTPRYTLQRALAKSKDYQLPEADLDVLLEAYAMLPPEKRARPYYG